MDAGGNAEISKDEVTVPLSPVLGSGQSRNLLKHRKRNRKPLRKCQSVLSFHQNIIEDENSSKNDCSLPTVPTIRDQETVVDRIRRLEALELKRQTVIKAISFNSLVPEDSLNHTTDTFPITGQVLPPEELQNIDTKRNEVNITDSINFQTGPGINIALSKPHIENSKKLFDDILHSSNFGASRGNKYNYMHWTPSSNFAAEPRLDESQPQLKLNSTESSLRRLNKESLTVQSPKYIPKTNISATESKLKNIFEGEDFEDLKLGQNSGFQSASLGLKTREFKFKEQTFAPEESAVSTLKHEIKATTEGRLQRTKNVVETANINDLSIGCNKGFEAAYLRLQTTNNMQVITPEARDGQSGLKSEIKTTKECAAHQVTKNIFEDENFEDLKPSSNGVYQGASLILKTSIKGPMYTIEEPVSALRPEIKTTKDRPPHQLTKNIFEGETFEDLKPGCDSGFQAASLCLKTNIKGPMCTIEEPVSALKSEIRASKKRLPHELTKNIFEGETFEDLKPGCASGFQAASLSLRTSIKGPMYTIEEPVSALKSEIKTNKDRDPHQVTKTIFEQENFDDLTRRRNIGYDYLKTTCRGSIQRPAVHEDTVPALKQKGKAITGLKPVQLAKNIFEGENFYDSRCQLGDFKSANACLTYEKQRQFTQPYVGQGSTVFTSSSKTEKYFENSSNPHSDFSKPSKGLAIPSNNHLQNKNYTPPKFQQKTNKVKSIFEGENFDDLKMLEENGFERASKTLHTTKSEQSYNEKYSKVSGSINMLVRSSSSMFQMQDESFDDEKLTGEGSRTKRFVPPTESSKQGGNFRSPFKTLCNGTSEYEITNDFKGFSLIEQRHTSDISNAIRQITEIIHDNFHYRKSSELKNIKDIVNVSETINTTKEKLNAKTNTSISRKRQICDVDSDCNISDLNCSFTTPNHTSSSKRPRKRLGCFVSPSIQISQRGIKRANLMFEDFEPATFSTSTPAKLEDLAKPLNCNLTPIPSIRKNLENTFSTSKACKREVNVSKTIVRSGTFNSTITATNNNRFSLNKPSETDVRVWLESLATERKLLEEQLRIVNEKQTILGNQATMLEFPRDGKIRPKPGILYKSKRKANRVRLQEYVQYSDPGDQASSNGFLDQINPQNAHLIHFTIFNKRTSHVTTEDGAVITPNIDSKIGISEIEHSFKLLEGVDPNLIPRNWIRNHFKWIIWKFASYERMFPIIFDGCLSLENVVQQLKYRYDVEIDNAHRSVIRKIFEKDDCPQRRLVLCVSKVVKINDTYELELSDGWYPIRTLIDLPLCDQILKGKIKIGIKLIVYGAELINCEGCHPLEAPDSVHLKISYNSTRRALWWCKLGYQRQSGPFVTPMSSINMTGGKIGCLKCFILRVYPVKYLETCGNKKVWRNRKAEERCEQNFSNENFKLLESLHNKSNINAVNGAKALSYNNLKNIEDPEVLYDILQSSHDPENLQEMLSSTQRTSLYNYSLNKSSTRQTTPWNDHKTPHRDVKAMLKIKIVDASYNSDKVYDFQIWSPTENHLHELREGEIVSIFNISCSLSWGLNANQNTQFRREGRPNDSRFEKFKRKVTRIKDMQTFVNNNILFNEFDTVGIVIKKQINENDQQVWMADMDQRLLLINIKDSPKNILVLDMVNEGQIVSACNLTFQNYHETHSFAVANHFVVFARYSQHSHLQEALDALENDFNYMDQCAFIVSCTNKIKQVELKKVNRNFMDLDDMECSQITTTDIALLECLEKLA